MYVRTYVHAVTNNCITQFIVTSFMSHAVSTRVLHYTIYIHLLLNGMFVVYTVLYCSSEVQWLQWQ